MSYTQKQKNISTRLSAARAHLILERPFIGALSLHLDLQPAPWCKSFATDTKKLYYNPEYVRQLDDQDLQFMFAHEVLHCALGHFFRKQGRVQHRWDIACDYAINGILLKEGLHSTQEILFAEMFDGLSAEEIYQQIKPQASEETIDEHLWNRDSGGKQSKSNNKDQDQASTPASKQVTAAEAMDKPLPLSQQEVEKLRNRWRQRMVSAAQQARQAGRFSTNLERLVEKLIKPRLPWQHLLAHHLRLVAREDYTYQRPNHRRSGNVIFPSLRSGESHTTIAIDVSGSIKAAEMTEFLSEVNAIKSFFRARITLLACAASLAKGSPWVYEPWEQVTLPASIQSDTGTDFRPVFDWVAQQDQAPDVLIYLTDGCGRFPAKQPAYPVLWLIKGNATAPWGQVIRLDANNA